MIVPCSSCRLASLAAGTAILVLEYVSDDGPRARGPVSKDRCQEAVFVRITGEVWPSYGHTGTRVLPRVHVYRYVYNSGGYRCAAKGFPCLNKAH